MNEQRLSSTRDFFDEITEKSYRRFMEGDVNFLMIYAMAYGLFHLADWVNHYDMPKVKDKFGEHINSGHDLWHEIIEKSITDAGLIRDLNNSAKHVKLELKYNPSTSMHYAANTYISMTGWDTASYGVSPNGGLVEVKMAEGGREILLEPVATSVFQFWEELMNEFYQKPPMVFPAGFTVPSANS